VEVCWGLLGCRQSVCRRSAVPLERAEGAMVESVASFDPEECSHMKNLYAPQCMAIIYASLGEIGIRLKVELTICPRTASCSLRSKFGEPKRKTTRYELDHLPMNSITRHQPDYPPRTWRPTTNSTTRRELYVEISGKVIDGGVKLCCAQQTGVHRMDGSNCRLGRFLLFFPVSSYFAYFLSKISSSDESGIDQPIASSSTLPDRERHTE
jgi:hypothetical protein